MWLYTLWIRRVIVKLLCVSAYSLLRGTISLRFTMKGLHLWKLHRPQITLNYSNHLLWYWKWICRIIRHINRDKQKCRSTKQTQVKSLLLITGSLKVSLILFELLFKITQIDSVWKSIFVFLSRTKDLRSLCNFNLLISNNALTFLNRHIQFQFYLIQIILQDCR